MLSIPGGGQASYESIKQSVKSLSRTRPATAAVKKENSSSRINMTSPKAE